jgi:hypothetical protein
MLRLSAVAHKDSKCLHFRIERGLFGRYNSTVQRPSKTRATRSQRQTTLPDHLISRRAIDELQAEMSEYGIDKEAEPDWKKLQESFREKYRIGEARADELVRSLERLWLLPFHRYDTCAPFLLFFVAELPAVERRFNKENDRDGLLLCAAYRVMVEILLQGVAVFPGEPHYIAQQLKFAIESPALETRSFFMPLAKLLGAATPGGRDRYLAKEPDVIAIHEHLGRRGRYDGVVLSEHKYKAYVREIEAIPQFWKEWQELKSAFPTVSFWDSFGIVRRSPLSERNWERGGLPNFKNPAERFQACFDIFCWKWFLYGMQRAEPRDRPLVQKIIYTFGPYGTILFIPGYWSFDAARDLDWKAISKLHKARGVPRQGEKLQRNRAELQQQIRRAHAADREAKRQGLRGEKRYSFIKQSSGLDMRTENAHVRRLLRCQSPC